MQTANHTPAQTQPIEMVPATPAQPESPVQVLYDPYSPVAIIFATCALVTAIGKVLHNRK